MCGIFGYAGNISSDKYVEAFRLLRQIGRESEIRGQDSTGFSCKFHETNRIVTDKMPYRASIFNVTSHKFRRLRNKMPELFIAHTRLGTGSSPIINNNNHPFYGKYYHMVHNGVIPAWKDVQKKHKLSMNSETDSEVILRSIEKARDDGKDTRGSVEKTLGSVWGNMAVALLDKKNPYIWLFRNENPINVFQIPKHVFGEEMYFFASLTTIFDDAWKTVFGNRYEKDGVEAILLNHNILYSISHIKQLAANKERHRFIYHQLEVETKFDKSKQYSPTNTVSTPYYSRIHFFSKVIDTDKPQLGLTISNKDVTEIKKKLTEKDGQRKVRVDGLTVREFAGLKTLVDDLYKVETKHFMKNRIVIPDAKDIREFSNKTHGTKTEDAKV